MALVGLLRREGPMTATQAADRLGESVPSCSYHLRQLAKYGLAERVPGGDARERPWRATALVTSWDDGSDDPAGRAATDQLNGVILDRYLERARQHLARRTAEPAEWRAVTGFSDALLYLTAEELAELTRRIEALLAAYDDRLIAPSARPDGARPISLIRLVLPADPAPPSGSPSPVPADPAASPGTAVSPEPATATSSPKPADPGAPAATPAASADPPASADRGSTR